MSAVVGAVPCPGPTMGPYPRETRWRARAAHLGGAVALVGAAAAVSIAWAHPATRPLARFCCRYSPGRLAGGEIWTLPGSALLLPRLRMMGPTMIMASALFLPYVMVAGTRRALAAFFAGHIVATSAVAAVVLPAAAWGWAPAVVLRSASDVGASAGLAAAAGALAGHLGWRRGGVLLGGALALWFGTALLVTQHLVEVEHLLALATGAAAERRGRGLTSPGGVSLQWRRARNILDRAAARTKGHDDGP